MSAKKKSTQKSKSIPASNTQKTKAQKKQSIGFNVICLICISALTFFTYKGALDHDFVDWDDYAYVIDNELVRSTLDMNNPAAGLQDQPSSPSTSIGDVFKTIISLNYHPLTMLTMRWNNNKSINEINNIDARPFILWNIILHILNSLLAFLFILKLSRQRWVALFVALIFALHPMHVESVAWVSERKDVLYVFFFLAAAYTYLTYLRTDKKKYIFLTFVLFLLSCLSKAMAVVFPLIMLLIYFWEQKHKTPFQSFRILISKRALFTTIPFFALSLLFGLIASNVQSGGDFGGLFINSSTSVAINEFDTFSIFQRLQFACYGFLQYLINFILPIDLCTFYPYPDQLSYDNSLFFKVLPFLVIILILLAFYSLKFTKTILFGTLFYLFAVVLVLQFISVGVVIMADRYSYLPYIGVAFMVAHSVVDLFPKQQTKILPFLCLFPVFLIPKTITQVATWQNSETLWTHVIELNKTEENVYPQNIEQALSIRGNFYGKMSDKAKNNKQRMSFINKAFEDFKIAAQLGSKRADVYEGLGNTYGMKGSQSMNKGDQAVAQSFFKEALVNYSKAITLKPNKGSVYFNRAITYSLLSEHIKAIEDYSKVLSLQPSQALMTYQNRAIAYINLKDYEKACNDFRSVLNLDPNNQNAKIQIQKLACSN